VDPLEELPLLVGAGVANSDVLPEELNVEDARAVFVRVDTAEKLAVGVGYTPLYE